MDDRRTYTFLAEPRGDAYRALLVFCASISAEAGVIVDSSRWPNARREAALAALAPHLVSTEVVMKWPGSETVPPYSATRYAYRPTPELVAMLGTLGDGLLDWVNPGMPDDLHFVRRDGSTVLCTISTEDVAWLELDESEWAEVNRVAQLMAILPANADEESNYED